MRPLHCNKCQEPVTWCSDVISQKKRGLFALCFKYSVTKFHSVADPLVGQPSMNKGLWVLAGLLVFIVLEKIFSSMPGNVDIQNTSSNLNVKQEKKYILNNNVKGHVSGYANGHCANQRTASNTRDNKSPIGPKKCASKKVHICNFV
jgi:hypothetical protein